MKYIVSLLGLLALILVTPFTANAQKVSQSLKPSSYAIIVKPGKTLKLSYTLTNTGDPITGKLRMIPNGSEASPITFIFENKELSEIFFLRDGETKNISLLMEVPVETQIKDYYFSFTFETSLPPSEEGTNNLRLATKLVSPLFISVSNSGITNSDIRIQTFYIKPDVSLPFGKIIFNQGKKILQLQIVNRGENFTRIAGFVHIDGIGVNKTISIPAQTIASESELLSSLPIDTLYVGSYRFSLNLQSSNRNRIQSIQTIWVFPILYIGLLIALIIGGVLFLKRVSGGAQSDHEVR